MKEIFKLGNLFWVFVIALDITVFKQFILESGKYPFLVEPPVLYAYLMLGIGLLILINHMAHQQRNFKYFIKDVLGIRKSTQ